MFMFVCPTISELRFYRCCHPCLTQFYVCYNEDIKLGEGLLVIIKIKITFLERLLYIFFKRGFFIIRVGPSVRPSEIDSFFR